MKRLWICFGFVDSSTVSCGFVAGVDSVVMSDEASKNYRGKNGSMGNSNKSGSPPAAKPVAAAAAEANGSPAADPDGGTSGEDNDHSGVSNMATSGDSSPASNMAVSGGSSPQSLESVSRVRARVELELELPVRRSTAGSSQSSPVYFPRG